MGGVGGAAVIVICFSNHCSGFFFFFPDRKKFFFFFFEGSMETNFPNCTGGPIERSSFFLYFTLLLFPYKQVP